MSHRSPFGAYSDRGQPGGQGDLCVARGAGPDANAARQPRPQLPPVADRLAPPSDARTLPGKVRQALLDDPEGLPAHLERSLVVLETLRAQIAQADLELKVLARADVRMRRLMTVPGVGPVTAARFMRRWMMSTGFPTPPPSRPIWASFLERTRRAFEQEDAAHSRRRAASPVGARTSGMVALSSSSSRSDGPVGQAGGRGAQVAIMALARKLAHVLYALWKHGTTYDPARGARPAAA